MKSDCRFGKAPSFYDTVEGWEDDYFPGVVTDIITDVYDDYDDKFEHIYVVVEVNDSYGAKTTTIEDVGFTKAQLAKDFIDLYNERLMFMPRYYGAPADHYEAYTRSYSRMKDSLETCFRTNLWKYLKLLETLGYSYDPISNYDMQEISGDAEKEGAREDNKSIRGQQVTTETAPELKTSTYTTTFDDDTAGRLEGYSVQEYEGSYKVDAGNVPIKETKKFYEGDNPGETSTLTHTNQVTLTQDEITTPSADKAYTHKLIRRGNIGVTSSQELIKAQRELVKFSLEREILNDMADALLLKVWG